MSKSSYQETFIFKFAEVKRNFELTLSYFSMKQTQDIKQRIAIVRLHALFLKRFSLLLLNSFSQNYFI